MVTSKDAWMLPEILKYGSERKSFAQLKTIKNNTLKLYGYVKRISQHRRPMQISNLNPNGRRRTGRKAKTIMRKIYSARDK